MRLLSGIDGEEMAEVVQVGPAANDLTLTRTLTLNPKPLGPTP